MLLYRCRGCNKNCASSDNMSLYQRKRIINNDVRMYSSLYTLNISALNAGNKKYWNNMSDRMMPHVQKRIINDGGIYRRSSVKNSTTSLKPSSLNPGGTGVDIKHNSYDRFLNKLKSRNIINSNKYNNVTNNMCECNTTKRIINNEFQSRIYDVRFKFNVGDRVYVVDRNVCNCDKNIIIEGIITSLDNMNNEVTLNLIENNQSINVKISDLLIYYPACTDKNNNIYDAILNDEVNINLFKNLPTLLCAVNNARVNINKI